MNPVNAKNARLDWLALLKRWSRYKLTTKSLRWLKVTELTKRKQIHHHLLVSFDGLSETKADCGAVDYKGRVEGLCSCFNCDMVRIWYGITGDSYVVDVTKVYSDGIVNYLTKYLAKSMRGGDRDILKARGMGRLWSTSRNWTRGSQMQRRGTVEGAWVSTGFAYGKDRFSEQLVKRSSKHWALEQVGTDMAVALYKDREFQRYAYIHEAIRSSGGYGRF